MRDSEIISHLLSRLGIFPEHSVDTEPLLSAARWALNNPNFIFFQYKPLALRPVLGSLRKGPYDQYLAPEPAGYKLKMPSVTQPDINGHYKLLKEKLRNVPPEKLLLTLEIHGSCIAFHEQYPDLSLYDFIRVTTGIACAIQNGNGQLRLAGGSISGIQSYLYDILSKNAAKLLKGRSFYLQLLSDSLSESLKKEFNLSETQVLYASGGGFYVFMPDKPDIETEFRRFSNAVVKRIYQLHKVALFVEFELTKPFEADAPTGNIWDDLFTLLHKRKMRRLEVPELLNSFFEDLEQGGPENLIKRDPVTNEELGGIRPAKLADDTEVHPFTKQQIDLGKELRQANYWIKNVSWKTPTIIDPLEIGHALKSKISSVEQLSNGNVFEINPSKAEIPFILYGGNKFPVFEQDENGFLKGDLKPFDVMVDNDQLKRLAILRMDVDGLGAVFSDAKEIDSSLYETNWVRYATISRSLDQFFKGHINFLHEEVESKDNRKDTSVIIYSGGDDLFVVGRWDTVLHLADSIHQNFKKWSCGQLTISGGLVFLPAKFPIMQGARMAADAEDRAKKHYYKAANLEFKKNAICFLDTPLNWEEEFRIVKDLKEELLPFIKSKKLTKSFLTQINIHAEAQKQYDQEKAKGRSPSPKWMAVMTYDFTRTKERVNKDDLETRDFIDKLRNGSLDGYFKRTQLKSKYSFLRLLQLAARWVEMEIRANKNNIE